MQSKKIREIIYFSVWNINKKKQQHGKEGKRSEIQIQTTLEKIKEDSGQRPPHKAEVRLYLFQIKKLRKHRCKIMTTIMFNKIFSKLFILKKNWSNRLIELKNIANMSLGILNAIQRSKYIKISPKSIPQCRPFLYRTNILSDLGSTRRAGGLRGRTDTHGGARQGRTLTPPAGTTPACNNSSEKHCFKIMKNSNV